jgi:hypothetical protein
MPYGGIGLVELHLSIFKDVDQSCLLGVYELYIAKTVHFYRKLTRTN